MPSFTELSRAQSPLRDAITSAYRRDERECVHTLIPQASLSPAQVLDVKGLARRLVTEVRAKRTRASGVDALMHEFSLSSQEGVALMCLAEALLRIPDKHTADRLIRDKISKGDWKAHLGQSQSLFVNAATWGLVVTGKLVSTHSETSLSSALTRLIAKQGEPVIRKGVDLAMRMLGKQFVTGETIDEALANGREREARGYRFSYDMLGEAAMTEADAQRYLADYEMAIHAIGKASAGRGVYQGPGISVKLSAIHPRYSRAQRDRVMNELLPRLKKLLVLAKQYNIGLNIDAEEADRMELSLDLLEALAFDPELAGWNGIGLVVQAYQKRCPYIIDHLIDLARRSHHRFMVRLVKGAYWDAEIKRAQVDGLPGYPVYTRKVYTDVSYLACAKKLLAAQDAIYPQFATHNAYSLAAVYELGEGKDYEFQCLHGMGETLYDQVVGDDKLGRACRIYAPVGSHETLLAYLVRRLLENGANTSFVNRIVDETVSIDDLIADPVEESIRLDGQPHDKIPLPLALYGAARANSRGIDLSSEHALGVLSQGLLDSDRPDWQALPLLAAGDIASAEPQVVLNPANHSDKVGVVYEASLADVQSALQAAEAAAPRWAATPVAERAACLQRVADAMEDNLATLMGLAIREAGKSIPNAIAEVREAIDFCRYYAERISLEFNNDSHQALGPVVCISPWNFPLAIFTGEVAAALAAGNPVLAKPAEQTALIATLAVRLFHAAGVPRDVLQLLPGRGEVVGAALTGDPRVKGVIFTGSTEVAKLIHRTLAARSEEVPLIAETGGQNAMIVDSSALPEQVVADVINSAFDSAGQRCSALRILCLQEDIADKVVAMLKGAMDQLTVGNPAQLATDIGPVIDAEARAGLLAHIERMKGEAKGCYQVRLGGACGNGTFVPPTLFEIRSIDQLKREVFGPVLHVIRFAAPELPQLIRDINATGYGLTLGVHSRIDDTIDLVCDTAHVGNIYVNRNIVGAVVGVQPFGGEGLSGTGPKAGGPLYLHRLARASVAPQLTADVQSPALERLAQLRAALPKLNCLNRHECEQLMHWAEQAAKLSPLARAVTLPGPTGETNSLRFAPRGTVACVADHAPSLVAQLIAALATDNRVLLGGAAADVVMHALPQTLAIAWLASPVSQPTLHAVLFEGPADGEAVLRAALAERDGPLVALHVCAQPTEADLYRLVAERTVSVNTTAAGGNASLMTLSD